MAKKGGNSWLIPTLIIGGASAWGLSTFFKKKSKRLGENIRFAPGSLKYNKSKSNLLNINFDASIIAENPESYSQKINSIFIEAKIKGKTFAQAKMNSPVTVAASGDTEIKFPLNLKPLNLGLTAFDLIQGGDLPDTIELKGFAYIPGGRIEINETIPTGL